MILVFSPQISNRIKYATNFILHRICGFDHQITSSEHEFNTFDGIRINYSDIDIPVKSIVVKPSGFLVRTGIYSFELPIVVSGNIPKIFPSVENNAESTCELGYDIFSAAFYLVSRYEEYLPFVADRYGRFEASQSFAHKHGFLEMPIIDVYSKQLIKKIAEKFPHEYIPTRKFTFIPTYDIDIAYAYKGRMPLRNILAFAKDLVSLDFENFLLRTKVLLGMTNDPFATYDYQRELHKKYSLTPVYFFLAARYSTYDKNISIRSKYFKALLYDISKSANTGIHPSLSSHYKKSRLEDEIKGLSKLLDKPIIHSRQHYLKIKFPETYQNLTSLGIKHEFSMGYASQPGFRAGTCTPFYFYNLMEECETPLLVFPTTLMDGTLNDYMKLTPHNAFSKAKSIIDSIREVDGTFISLWHNDSLSDRGRWKGWREVYEKILHYATRPKSNF